jgi:CTP synthase (UTP-ammonia lyase)
MMKIRIGIVGDFDRGKHSHWATEAALFHAAAKLGLSIEPRWIATPTAEQDPALALDGVHGVWGAPGSPFVSMRGMLRAVEHARVTDTPYLGTCAGFQYALIEITRNLLGLPNADSAENDPDGDCIVITPVQCQIPSGPRLAGSARVALTPGSLLARLCESTDLQAEYFCSFETNTRFEARWQAAGVRFGARGLEGEPRALELPDRRFFVATLFQPQLSSRFDQPHPIVLGFLKACAAAAGH